VPASRGRWRWDSAGDRAAVKNSVVNPDFVLLASGYQPSLQKQIGRLYGRLLILRSSSYLPASNSNSEIPLIALGLVWSERKSAISKFGMASALPGYCRMLIQPIVATEPVGADRAYTGRAHE
jgi:hypothetical protein